MIYYRFGNDSYFPFFRVVILCFETFSKFVQIASWMIFIKKPGVG